MQVNGRENRRMTEPGLQKSWITPDGLRVRVLRTKESDRWLYHNLPQLHSGLFFDTIYTVDQALELGIDFRSDFHNPHPEIEKEHIESHLFMQRDDFVVTESPGPLDEYWVMRVLWRNYHPKFPYIRTATGSYGLNAKNIFDGADSEAQYSVSKRKPYHGPLRSERMEVMIAFVVKLIMEKGFYSKEIIKIAYQSVYSVNPSWQKVVMIMNSETVMTKIAEQLKEALQENGADINFIIRNMMEMASTDYDKDPERRLDVLKLLARQHGLIIENGTIPALPVSQTEPEAIPESREVQILNKMVG